VSRALGPCASKAMCAKTNASLKQLNFKEVRKHQELALHRFYGNDFFVSPPTGSGKSVIGCSKLLSTLYAIELTPLARHDCIFTA